VHDNTVIQISNNAAGVVKSSSYDNSVYDSWNNHFTNDTYQLADLSGLYFTWMDSSGKNAYATHTWPQWQSFGNDVQGTLQLLSSAGTTEPSLPTNLSATAISSSQINLIWTASTDKAGVTGYKIYRGGSQIATSTSNTYSDSSLSAGTTYTYTVAAFDAAGNASAQSASAAATTSGSAPP
jgi:fibronectin type 3 domain-containing protein